MGGGRNRLSAEDETEPTGFEDQDLSRANQAKAVPYFAGEAKLSATFICRPYNQKAVEAPDEFSKK